eukprot:9430332-Pyramimonas_sp.AAC.2
MQALHTVRCCCENAVSATWFANCDGSGERLTFGLTLRVCAGNALVSGYEGAGEWVTCLRKSSKGMEARLSKE